MRRYKKIESIVARKTINRINRDITYWEKILNGYCCYPQIVELNFGTHCNQDCLYCYNKNHKYYPHTPSNTLGKHEIDVLINSFVDMNVKYIFCSGGLEFFTSRHSYYTINKIIENGLKLIVFTNGSLIEERHFKLLIKCHYVRFSIDSFAINTYKKIRGNHANFNCVINNIKTLIKNKQEKRSKTKIGISAIINRFNLHELDDLIVEANNLGINAVDIKTDYTDIDNVKIDYSLQKEIISRLKNRCSPATTLIIN